MELQHDLTLKSWTDDFLFLMTLRLRDGLPDAQQARFRDYLEMRYEPQLVEQAFETLKQSYNFIARHWTYLKDVGLIRAEDGRDGIVNCLILALREVAFTFPHEQLIHLPATDPRKMVKIAQKYVDAEKADGEHQQ